MLKNIKIPYVFVNTNIKNHENKIFLILKKYKIDFICLCGLYENYFYKNY